MSLFTFFSLLYSLSFLLGCSKESQNTPPLESSASKGSSWLASSESSNNSDHSDETRPPKSTLKTQVSPLILSLQPSNNSAPILLKPNPQSLQAFAKQSDLGLRLFKEKVPRSQLSVWGFDSESQLESLVIEEPIAVYEIWPDSLSSSTPLKPSGVFRYPLSSKGRFLALISLREDSNGRVLLGDMGAHPLARCIQMALQKFPHQQGFFWRAHLLQQDFWVFVDPKRPMNEWSVAELRHQNAFLLEYPLKHYVELIHKHPLFKGQQ